MRAVYPRDFKLDGSAGKIASLREIARDAVRAARAAVVQQSTSFASFTASERSHEREQPSAILASR
jgi:hypothetical protein